MLAEARGRLAEGLAQAVVEARPEEIEELVVGGDFLAALHHRGAQRVLEDLAVVDRELVERGERVDRLGGRDADPALAQDVGELEDLLLHARPARRLARLVQRALLGGCGLVQRALFGGGRGRARRRLGARASPAFFWSSLSSSACALRTSPSYLRITLKVWFTSSCVELGGVQREQRARPVERLADRRRLLQVELAQPVHHAHQVLDQLSPTPGHLRLEDPLLELLRSGSRCRGAGSGA